MTVTAEQREILLAKKCIHCGGVHDIACPRVKRLRFRPDGVTLLEVEFFPAAEWKDEQEHIVWLEDLFEPGSAPEEKDADESLPAPPPVA